RRKETYRYGRPKQQKIIANSVTELPNPYSNDIIIKNKED
ncbi:hypothetical protein FHW89_005520, partial [Mucilaginibacter sp. SG564]|nr:hypothetical protein [Mucilaginibacter sp. SG564]